MGKSKHDRVAGYLAGKHKTVHKRTGIDIVTPKRAIEVAISPRDIKKSRSQIGRANKPGYIATDKVALAKKIYEGTGIGVMNTQGRIFKKARRW